MLAAAYLFGTALAGVLRTLCDRGDIQLLTDYLTCWQKLFAAQDSGAAVGLFLAEYLTVAGALTAVLLLGLSALGPLPVFLFVILYGIGTGLISAPLFGEFQLPQSLVYLLLGGIPAAIAAGCLCLFGTSALQVCSRLHSVSFGGKIPAPTAGKRAVARRISTAAIACLSSIRRYPGGDCRWMSVLIWNFCFAGMLTAAQRLFRRKNPRTNSGDCKGIGRTIFVVCSSICAVVRCGNRAFRPAHSTGIVIFKKRRKNNR